MPVPVPLSVRVRVRVRVVGGWSPSPPRPWGVASAVS